MGLESKVLDLKRNIIKLIKEQAVIQVRWVKVKSVDWEKKTMVATGVVDELDYNNVLLGLGSKYSKPAVGSKCLVAIIENMDAAAFLVSAQSVEELEINGQSVIINGGNNGGIPVVGKIDNNLQVIKEYLDALNTAILDFLSVLDGLAGASGAILADYAEAMLPYTLEFENMANNSVKH